MIKDKILVADDEQSMREFLDIMLKKEGYKVSLASNGEEVGKLVENDLFDLVLLDIRMPKLDGFQVFEKLRADPVTAHIPVAFFTADKDFTDFRKAQEMGSLIYISKPFKPNTLVDSVQMLLATNRRRRAGDV